MELSELKFAVNTAELKEAVDLLGKVQQGTADLGKAQAQQEKAAKKAAKSQTEVSDALEDSEKKISPLEKLLQKLNNQYGDLVKGFTKGEAAILQQARTYGAAEDALQPFIAELEKIKELTKDPFDASVGAIRSVSAEFDRLSQRAELAQRGISLSTKQLSEYSRISAEVKGKVLELGMDPKSAAGVEKFNQLLAENRNEYLKVAAAANALEQAESLRNKTLRDNERLLAANLQAQATMMNDAVKLYQNAEADKAKALAARMRMEATAGDNAVQLFYKNEQQKQKAFEARMKAEATMMDGAVIKYYTMQSKNGNKAEVQSIREREQALKRVTAEESKMTSILNTLTQVQDKNTEVSEKAARSIANYERDLRKAGVTAEDTATKLDTYRKQQAAVQKIEEDRQGKFLTRALQPQIGDVVVSIAAGQNPLTVMLQQMDQVRGLIAQTGVQGEALRTVMRNAFTDTIKSVKDTAIAMGSVLGGAFIALGNNVMGLVTGPFAAFKASAEAGASAGTSLTAAVTALNAAFTRLVGNPIVALIVATGTALAALGIAFYQVSRQGDEMSKTLALNGGTLGLTRDSAISYAQSLNEVGVSTSKAVDVITAMSKAGGFVASDIEIVGKTAVMMQRDVGIAIEDTVKNFAKLKDKPVEALIELAKASGYVTAANIEAVNTLVKQGDMAAAAAKAMEISADVQTKQAARIKQEYSNLGATLNWVGTQWDDLWNKIKGSVYEDSPTAKLQKQIADTQDTINMMKAQASTITFGLANVDEFGPIKAKQKVLDALKGQLSAQEKLAANQGAELVANQKAASVKEQQLKLAETLDTREADIMKDKLTRQQTINAAIEKEAKLRKSVGGTLSADEVSRISSVAGAEYDKSKAKGNASAAAKEQRKLNSAMNTYNDILGKSDGFNADFNDKIKDLRFLLDNGAISEIKHAEAMEQLGKQQPKYIQGQKEINDAIKERATNQEWLNALMDKSEGKGKEYSKGLKVIKELGLEGDEKQAALAALEKTTPAYKALDAVMANYGKTLADVNAQRTELQDSYSTDFMTDSEKAAYQSLSKFKRSQAEADAEYNKALADAKKYEDSEYYAMMGSLAKDVADRRKATAQDVYDREKYLQSQTYQMYAAGFEALKGLSANFSTAVADQFINFAKTGKSSFEDLTSSFGNMVENMIYDLIRLQIQKQVAGLLDMGVSAAVSYFGGGAATTGSSMYALTSGGSGLASMGGGTGVTVNKALALGGAFNNGVQMYAKGGVFDGPTMFGHSGGLGVLGEAGAEAVMPLKRDASGSLGVAVTGGGSAGSNVEVVINNYGSEKATTTETTDSRGNRKINISIGEMVSGEISRSGSAVQKSMQSTYGQRPQLIRR